MSNDDTTHTVDEWSATIHVVQDWAPSPSCGFPSTAEAISDGVDLAPFERASCEQLSSEVSVVGQPPCAFSLNPALSAYAINDLVSEYGLPT